MRCFITGCGGFIGSALADRLLADGHEVVGFDNFASGHREFLTEALDNERFRLVAGDLLDRDALSRAMSGAETVFHLAANADVRHGTEDPRRDLQQNVIATANVLDAMRESAVERIVFTSSGSVYGEPAVFPTPEECPFPVQTSLYGASKAAAEGLITAYCLGFGLQGTILRLVSVLGERYTHGHVFDFYRKLQADPTQIEVLGNGKQRKSYMYVQDCVDGMLLAYERADRPVSIFNLGTAEYCTVDESLGWICDELGLRPQRRYTGGERGWTGDSPFIFLDCSRIRTLGWRPRLSIRASVVRTLSYLRSNEWVFGRRG